MDLWVVSFNLSVHSTVPLQQKLFKNCFRGIEMFNPLYCKEWYTYWCHDIGCCLNQVCNRCSTTFSQKWTGLYNPDSYCILLADPQTSNHQGRARFECSIGSVKCWHQFTPCGIHDKVPRLRQQLLLSPQLTVQWPVKPKWHSQNQAHFQDIKLCSRTWDTVAAVSKLLSCSRC